MLFLYLKICFKQSLINVTYNFGWNIRKILIILRIKYKSLFRIAKNNSLIRAYNNNTQILFLKMQGNLIIVLTILDKFVDKFTHFIFIIIISAQSFLSIKSTRLPHAFEKLKMLYIEKKVWQISLLSKKLFISMEE